MRPLSLLHLCPSRSYKQSTLSVCLNISTFHVCLNAQDGLQDCLGIRIVLGSLDYREWDSIVLHRVGYLVVHGLGYLVVQNPTLGEAPGRRRRVASLPTYLVPFYSAASTWHSSCLYSAPRIPSPTTSSTLPSFPRSEKLWPIVLCHCSAVSFENVWVFLSWVNALDLLCSFPNLPSHRCPSLPNVSHVLNIGKYVTGYYMFLPARYDMQNVGIFPKEVCFRTRLLTSVS